MVKKNIFVFIFFFSFSLIKSDEPVAIKPQSTDIPKIRVIEGRKIVAQSVQGRELEARLTEMRNRLDGEIKSLDQKIEKNLTDLRGRARTVDPEILEKDQEKLMAMKKERDAKAESYQGEFERTFQRELGKFNVKIKETVEAEAQKHGWDLVQIKETGEIIYSSAKIDATDDIIRAHDAKYKSKKAPAAAPTTPALAPVVKPAEKK